MPAMSSGDDVSTVHDKHPLGRLGSDGPGRVADTVDRSRYELRTVLGSGGMGEVWLAEDVRMGRDVAVKVMHTSGNPDAAARFLREARVQGRLDHPCVVPVHELGPSDEVPYFAMKRLAGVTLHEVLEHPTPIWTRRILLARFVEVCLAIEFAHRRGVIHRDLKPANIMLGEFGETYVLDWGLAKVSEAAKRESRHAIEPQLQDLRSDLDQGGRTVAGSVMGTPGYMSPEQTLGRVVDSRTDVFALGCILIEILTGSPAISRTDPVEATLAAACHRPSLRHPELQVPPELDELCAAATAASREQRVATARELADAVQRFLDGDRDLEQRIRLSNEHGERAAAAFARNDEVSRALAMREAGSAIALDPRNATAQGLLVRLLLEVPDPLPAEARRSIESDRCEATRTVLRIGVRAYLANLALIPLCKLVGVGGTWPFVMLAIDILVQAGVCAYATTRPRPLTPAVWAMLLANHVIMLTMIGIFFGSLILVPIFALGMMPIMLSIPQIYNPLLALAIHVLALALPLLSELVGLSPRTFTATADGVVFRPWAVQASAEVTVVAVFVIVVMQLWINMRVLSGGRRAQERAHELTHAQRWQLGRLVQRA